MELVLSIDKMSHFYSDVRLQRFEFWLHDLLTMGRWIN